MRLFHLINFLEAAALTGESPSTIRQLAFSGKINQYNGKVNYYEVLFYFVNANSSFRRGLLHG